MLIFVFHYHTALLYQQPLAQPPFATGSATAGGGGVPTVAVGAIAGASLKMLI
jgi:hypothetical protein